MTPEKLYEEQKRAMRARDAVTLAVVKAVRQEVHDAEIRDGRPATADDVTRALRRVERTTREERDMRLERLGADDGRAAMLSVQLDWLESALPAQVTPEELRALVLAAVEETGCTSMRQMRDVIAHVRAHAAAEVDNAAVAAIVREAVS